MLIAYRMWGRSIIAEAYHGQSWPILNQLMAGKSNYPVEHYFSRAEVPLYRLIIALVVMSPVFFALPFREALDRHRAAILITLGAAVLLISGWISLLRPFWYDELFTFYTARSETAVTVVNVLLAGGDNHPPLDYVFRHFSMRLFGDSTLAFRLPSMLSALVASIGLYLFARKRTSFFAAVVAFAVPFCTFAVNYAYEGRHSMPMFALACLALLAWQRVTERPTDRGRLALLAISLALAPFIHFYGVFNLVPILVGESIRALEERKVCWPVVISIGASQACLVLLYPFLANSIGFSGNFWTSVTPADLFIIYGQVIGIATTAFFVFLLAYLLIARFTPGGYSLHIRETRFPHHEIAAVITYCLMPIMLYLVAELFTGAFLARYTIIAVIGVALTTSLVVDRIAAKNQGCAAIIMAYFWLAGLANLGAAAVPYLTSTPDHVKMVEIIENDLAREQVPIVIPHAHRFLETYHYLPDHLKDRIYFIADRSLAVEYQGFDTAELAAINLKRVKPVNAFTFCDFLERAPEFIALGDGGWLMNKLKDDRAEITSTELKGVSVHRVSAGAPAASLSNCL